jgi:hypothetical protein
MVIEVQAQRALADAAIEKERSDQKALKEREIAEIRAKQERAIDTQAIRDGTMAARLQEEKAEADRKREEDDIAKRRQMVKQCQADREMMVSAKKERLLQQATIEQAEFQMVMDANRKARDEAKRQAQRKLEIDREYRTELGQDVERRWQSTKIDPAKKVKEGRLNQEANAEYLEEINRLREEKLEALRKKGVPEKYLVDIQADRFDIK